MALKSSLASCKVRRCPVFVVAQSLSRTGVSGKKYREVLSFDVLLKIQN